MASGNDAVTREDILRATEELFERHGYHATSMRQIADAVGLKAGSLYSHIASKEEILCDIVGRIASDLLLASQAARDLDAPPTERLRAFIRGQLEAIARHPKMANVLLMEWRSLPMPQKNTIRRMRDGYEKNLEKIITDGQVSGEFRGLNPKWVRFVILSTINWASQWLDPNGPNTPAEIADGFLDVVLQGIRQNDESRRSAVKAPRRSGSPTPSVRRAKL